MQINTLAPTVQGFDSLHPLHVSTCKYTVFPSESQRGKPATGRRWGPIGAQNSHGFWGGVGVNSKQRRYQRRAVVPAILSLIDALEQAAKLMRETGQTLTPEECDHMADGLRAMLKCEPDWERIATGRTTPTTKD